MVYDTVWYTRCPVPTALGLADRLGYLEEVVQRNQFLLKRIQQAPDIQTQNVHFTQALPGAIRHGGNIPAIWTRASGVDIRVVGLSWANTPHPLLARRQSGIYSVRDLKGKKIGIARRQNDLIDFWHATGLRILETLLLREGLTLADVTLAEIVVPRSYIDSTQKDYSKGANTGLARGGSLQREEITALLREEVDVIFSQCVFATALIEFFDLHVVADAVRSDGDKANNSLPLVLTMDARLIDEFPNLAEDILAASVSASDWAQNNISEAVRLIASEEGVAEHVLERTYSEVPITSQLGLDFSGDKIAALHSQKEFLARNHFITDDFDFDAWLDPRPLTAALQRDNASLFHHGAQ